MTRKWVILCCTVYFISYLIRHCYTAVLVEIISDLQTSKQLASVAVTGAFFTYGGGQFISGWLGDRVAPYRIIMMGLVSTSIINLLIAAFPNIYFMNVIWIFSGLFHSLTWAPLVRIIHQTFPEETEFQKAIKSVSQSAYVGTFSIYILAAIFVALLNWRMLFAATGFAGIAFAVVWHRQTQSLTFDAVCNEQKSQTEMPMEKITVAKFISAGMIPLLLVTVGVGCLRDGIATWMPTYFSEVFGIKTSAAILSSIVLPLCAIAAVSIAAWMSSRSKSDMSATLLLMLGATLLCSVLYIAFSHSAVLDLLLMALACCCLRGGSFLLTCYVPRYFAQYGKVSTFSGITNGALYIGSAAATYLLATIADRYGWQSNIAVWVAIGAFCVVNCIFALKRWKQFAEKE